MGMYSSQPTSLVTDGIGIPWQIPTDATAFGIGAKSSQVISSVTISGNVVTFETVQQTEQLVAGQTVLIDSLITNQFLNGVTLTVLSAGLSATQFSANYTHADMARKGDAGRAMPTTKYAFAQNLDGAVTPGTGQYVTYAMAEGAWGPYDFFRGIQLGFPCFYQVDGQTCNGFSGISLNEPTLVTHSPPVTIPTLPAGATVVDIYPVGLGVTAGGANMVFSCKYSGTTSPSVFLMTGAWERGSSIGTDLSKIGTAHFELSVYDSLYGSDGYYSQVLAAGFAVVYTVPLGGTPIPPTQLQTLEGTNCGTFVPIDQVLSGIEVTLNAGIERGSTCSLQAQLTLGGIPIGIPKPITVGPWTTSYTLGGFGDRWGTGLATTNQLNGASGIGVNVSGTLADGTQVNLNSLQISVVASTIRSLIWVSVGTTRPPTV